MIWLQARETILGHRHDDCTNCLFVNKQKSMADFQFYQVRREFKCHVESMEVYGKHVEYFFSKTFAFFCGENIFEESRQMIFLNAAS